MGDAGEFLGTVYPDAGSFCSAAGWLLSMLFARASFCHGNFSITTNVRTPVIATKASAFDQKPPSECFVTTGRMEPSGGLTRTGIAGVFSGCGWAPPLTCFGGGHRSFLGLRSDSFFFTRRIGADVVFVTGAVGAGFPAHGCTCRYLVDRWVAIWVPVMRPQVQKRLLHLAEREQIPEADLSC